jgi:hypothetical protein
MTEFSASKRLDNPAKLFPRRFVKELVASAKPLRLLGVLFGLICITPCLPQSVSGSITGTVIDPTGLPISNCNIGLRQETTTESRSTTTSAAGEFYFSSVAPGTYSVEVKCQGFTSFERNGNVLTANETLALAPLQLKVGSVSEQVTVNAEGSTVQTESSQLSAQLTATQLQEIATRGRDVLSLMKLLPGASWTPDNEAPGLNFIGTVNTPNINGMRTWYNNYTVDGLSSNDTGDTVAWVGTVNLDAIAEVNVLVNNYEAQYGRNLGASINMVTKAGTSTFHGTAYTYIRNEALNANTFFNNLNNVRKPEYRYLTNGFNLGGPVIIPRLAPRSAGRVFFFYSLELGRIVAPQPLVEATVPTALERMGNFSQSDTVGGVLIPIIDPTTGVQFPGNIVPTNRINSSGQGILNVFPLPNATNIAITNRNYNYTLQENLLEPRHNQVYRADFRASSKDLIYVRGNSWIGDEKGYAAADAFSPEVLSDDTYLYTDNDLSADYVHIFTPSILNEFNAGVRDTISQGGWETAADLAKLQRSTYGITVGQLDPQNNPLDIIPEASFASVTNAAPITYDPRFPSHGIDTEFNVNDGFSVNYHSHAFKFGLFLDRIRQEKSGSGTFGGNFNFTNNILNPLNTGYAYSNALLGVFSTYSESTTRPILQGRFLIMDWYGQDEWRVNRKLSLQLGIRTDWYQRPYSRTGQVAIWAPSLYQASAAPTLFQPAIVKGVRMAVDPLTGQPYPAAYIGGFVPNTGNTADGMVTGTASNYPRGFATPRSPLPEPRVGFSYDLFGNSGTAIRGGFGSFHNQISEGQLLQNWRTDPPIQYNPTIYYGYMSSLLSDSGILFPSSVYAYPENIKTATAYEYSLDVQRNVGFGTVVAVGYSGNVIRHLSDSKNINEVPYGAEFLPQNQDPTSPGKPLPDEFFAPYSGYGSITYDENESTSNYNSFYATADRRLARGLLFGTVFTWSKAMDYTDSDYGLLPTYAPLRAWSYGPSGFNQKFRFIANYTWDIPRASRLIAGGFVKAVFDNWKMSGVTSFVSGMPGEITFTTTNGVNITGGGDGSRVVMTGSPNSCCRTFKEWFNPNSVAEPAVGTMGNAPKDNFTEPGVNNWDMTFFKDQVFAHEKVKAEFRWEIYNVFNHPQYATVNSAAQFNATGQQVNGQFGQVITTLTPRVMQGSLRFTF